MHASQHGLNRSVDSVVHELASAQLERARVALVRAELEADPDGMRDFRAASSALRSLLHAYPQALCATGRKTSLRQLRKLAQLTAAERNAEEQLEWLRNHLGADSPAVAATRTQLERELETTRAQGHARSQTQALPAFMELRKEVLASTRGHAPLPAHPGAEPAAPPSFAQVCAGALEALSQTLQQRLHGTPPQLGEEGRARAARRVVRRLHGLLEPLRHSLTAVRGALQQLRGLQGALGELRVLRSLRSLVRSNFERAALQRARARWNAIENPEAPPDASLPAAQLEDGCLQVGRSIENRRRELSSALGAQWYGGAGAPFFGALGRIARELAGDTLAAAANPPAAAGPPTAGNATGEAGETSTSGLRAARSPRGERYYRTVQQRFGSQLIEFEKAIPRGEFERLQAAGAGVRLSGRSRVRAPIQELLQRRPEFEADAAAADAPAAAQPDTAAPESEPGADAARAKDGLTPPPLAPETADPARAPEPVLAAAGDPLLEVELSTAPAHSSLAPQPAALAESAGAQHAAAPFSAPLPLALGGSSPRSALLQRALTRSTESWAIRHISVSVTPPATRPVPELPRELERPDPAQDAGETPLVPQAAQPVRADESAAREPRSALAAELQSAAGEPALRASRALARLEAQLPRAGAKSLVHLAALAVVAAALLFVLAGAGIVLGISGSSPVPPEADAQGAELAPRLPPVSSRPPRTTTPAPAREEASFSAVAARTPLTLSH